MWRAEILIDCMSNVFILRVHINDFENLKNNLFFKMDRSFKKGNAFPGYGFTYPLKFL